MKVRTFSYLGTGAVQTITDVGTWDFMIVRARNTNLSAVLRFGYALTAGTPTFPLATSGPVSDLVTACYSDGSFDLGTGIRMNKSGVTYDALLITNESGDSYTGSYVGDGSDDRNITGFGFDPALVIVVGTATPLWKSSNHAGDFSGPFGFVAGAANQIQALITDGIQIGSSTNVNTAGSTYYVFACKNVANIFQVFSYTGNATDNRAVPTGFSQPISWSFVQINTVSAFMRTPGHVGDASAAAVQGTDVTDRIQAHKSNGDIEVGASANVNNSGSTVRGFAFKATPATGIDAALGSVVVTGRNVNLVEGPTSIALGTPTFTKPEFENGSAVKPEGGSFSNSKPKLTVTRWGVN